MNNQSMNRFIEKDDVVSDRFTGLMWTKNAALYEFPVSWREAFDFIQDLNHSAMYGYRDWKLANRRELFSLISHDTINPSLPAAHPFINIFPGYYWTSTSCARRPDQAWYIHLGGARVFKGMKYGSYMAWPVRSENQTDARVFQTGQQCCYDEKGRVIDCCHTGQDGEFQAGVNIQAPRFNESTDSVHDNATGLTWLKNANCSMDMLDWRSANDFVEKMNKTGEFGHQDWRLPHIVELESLTDMSEHSPALPADHKFTDVQEFYWSATTSMYDTRYGWALYLKDGAVGVGYKQLSEFYLWPVRGK